MKYRFIKMRVSDVVKMNTDLKELLRPDESVVGMVEDGPSILLLVRVGK